MYDKRNVFAKIIRKELPCQEILETEYSLAFNDLHPAARVHVLLIPKGPYENIADFIEHAPVAERDDFWNAVLSVVDKLGIRDNFRTVANTGAKAGQSVPHFHIHIMSD